MRIAYADPPYVGQAKKHYEGKEVNHPLLIAYLETFDGWALSCSSSSLQYLLNLCPKDVRIGAWVKPFCSWKVGVNPAYAWEPVIFKSVRTLSRDHDTTRDWVSADMTTQKGTHGVKPIRFSWWLFKVLCLQAGDEFCDIFPGSGVVAEAWENLPKQGFLMMPGSGSVDFQEIYK